MNNLAKWWIQGQIGQIKIKLHLFVFIIILPSTGVSDNEMSLYSYNYLHWKSLTNELRLQYPVMMEKLPS